jgi:predicted transcriptional regulator
MIARTTVRLPEDLMREVKRLATETDRSLTAVIEDALREHLSRRSRAIPRKRTGLPTDGEGGLRPGVEIGEGRDLRDLLDEDRGVDRLR